MKRRAILSAALAMTLLAAAPPTKTPEQEWRDTIKGENEIWSAMAGYFSDDLTGGQTLGGGRYVSISDFGGFPPRNTTIDFNLAHNALCARAPWFTCPIATDVLATAVRAGEKDPHQAH